MKIRAKKMIATSCALAMTLSSLTTLAQGPQETNPKRIEKVEKHEVVIMQSGGEPGQDFNIQVPSPMGGGFVFGDNTFQFISSEMSFSNKVVKGAPYSADAVTETTQMLADGNRIVRRSTAQLYRDGEGRTRREQEAMLIGPLAAGAEIPKMIYLNDPVAGVTYMLNLKDRTANKIGLRVGFREITPGQTGQARMARRPGTVEVAVSGDKAMAVSGGVLQSSAVKKVQPTYPPIAKAAHAQGPVQVKVVVGENGEVLTTDIVGGHPLLRDAAQDAAAAAPLGSDHHHRGVQRQPLVGRHLKSPAV